MLDFVLLTGFALFCAFIAYERLTHRLWVRRAPRRRVYEVHISQERFRRRILMGSGSSLAAPWNRPFVLLGARTTSRRAKSPRALLLAVRLAVALAATMTLRAFGVAWGRAAESAVSFGSHP